VTSDAEIVARVRRGDRDAFTALVSRYERSILALALAGVHDLHTAEDVVQATFLRAYQKLASLSDASRFGPWLMQIARNQVIDALRARRVPVTLPAESSQPSRCDNSLDAAWIEREHLLGMVARLPEHERLVLGLRYFDGLSVAAIASATARPVGTVTKQLSRAIARLRDWMAEGAQR
jgi:RNA polymerase sigma-70 factor, ECF subfamily